MSKYLVVGLGNIGEEYNNTRHNIGFKVLDAIAEAENIKFETDRLGDVTRYKYRGKVLVLLKPSTFMNLSGKAVNYWLQTEKIPLQNLLVVTDDIALPVGSLRLRGKGGAGGHNGLKNIAEVLNSQNYARVRFGVGNDYPKGKQVDHVLGEWTKAENEVLVTRVEAAIKMIQSFVAIGLQHTMTALNNK